MRHLGLFEGIGGFSLAAKWMGWQTIAWCEWNLFGQKVLKHHFPEAIGYGDIAKTDFTKYANSIDIITGGFPCQPFSDAGKRKGTTDDRYLWPEMLRAIREVQPRWVVGENVSGLLSWSRGMVFDKVQADLEAKGYEVLPFLLPACGKNAPHKRERIWFIAHSIGSGAARESGSLPESGSAYDEIINHVYRGSATDSNCTVKPWQHVRQTQQGKFNRSNSGNGINNFKDFPTQSPICGGNDGLPSELYGITFSKWRNESLKAYGNAIVPQVALEIFKAIDKMEKHPQSQK